MTTAASTWRAHAPLLLSIAGAAGFNLAAGGPAALAEVRDVLPDRALTLPFAAAATALWLGYLGLAAGRRTPSGAALAAYATVIVALFLLTPVTLSYDLLDYIRRGRVLSVHGANPHVVPSMAFPADPFHGDRGWTIMPTPYGPAFTLLSAALTWIAGDGRLANILVFKAAATAALAASFLAARRVAGDTRPALLYLLNPFVLLEVVANGHNDVYPVGAVLLSLRCLQTGAAARSGVLLALAACFKAPFACLLPLWLWYLARPRDRDPKASHRAILRGGLLGALLAALLWAPFFAGAATFDVLRLHASMQTKWSVPALLGGALAGAGIAGARTLAAVLCAAAAAALVLPFALRARSWNAHVRATAIVLLVLPLLAMGWLLPWYFVWPLALLPLVQGPWWRAVAVALTGALLAHYVQLTWLGFASSPWENLVLCLTTIGPPLFVLLAALLRGATGRQSAAA